MLAMVVPKKQVQVVPMTRPLALTILLREQKILVTAARTILLQEQMRLAPAPRTRVLMEQMTRLGRQKKLAQKKLREQKKLPGELTTLELQNLLAPMIPLEAQSLHEPTTLLAGQS
jgi:hypothetical protein